MTPSLDIIVVNWNAGGKLKRCVQSIKGLKESSMSKIDRVVIVDNASKDSSVDQIDKRGLPLTIIHNSQNKGFAKACNQGAKGSKADYLLFLNPDTILFEDSLELPLDYMERSENQHVAITGVKLVNEEGNVARTCARFPTPKHFLVKSFGLHRLLPGIFTSYKMSDWKHEETREVDQVMGAFFLVRQPVFEKLGGFDERFFVYFEDLDFSYRVQKEGLKSVYLAETQVYHEGGGTSRQVKARRLFYHLRSELLFGLKHFSFLGVIVTFLGVLFIEPFTRVIWNMVQGSVSETVETLHGYWMLVKELPKIIKDKSSAKIIR